MTSKLTRGLGRAVAAVALSGAATLTGVAATAAPAAAATPTKCHYGEKYDFPSYSWYRCDGGGGYYRAVAWCAVSPHAGFTYVWGPYRAAQSGIPSYAQCPSNKPYLVGGNGET